MIYRTNKHLRAYLREGGHSLMALMPFFVLPDDHHRSLAAEAQRQHGLEDEIASARGAYRALTMKRMSGERKWRIAQVILAVVIILLLLSLRAHAQTPVDIDRVGGVRQTTDTIKVNCTVGCSASAGFPDNSPFTAGTTPVSITGGWYSTTPTNCTDGDACAPQLTLDRKFFVQSFQGTSPWVTSISTWAGGTLGAMANYGTSPGAVLVPGMNAFITNIPHMVCDSGCAAGASFADSTAFSFGVTSISPFAAVVDDVATNTVAENSAGNVRMNANRILYIDLSKTLANTNKFLVTADPITFASPQAVTGTFWPTTAGAPSSTELSDGAAFYVGTKTGQLPTALDGSGFLKVHEQGSATVTGTVSSTQGTNPWVVSVPTWAGGTLGAMATYGTSPGAVLVPGMNSFITNIPHVIVDTAPSTAVTQSTSPWVTSCTATNCTSKISDGTTTAGVIAATTALKTDVSSVAGTATSTAAAGVQKVGVVGNTGAAIDSAPGAALSTNVLVVAGRDSTQAGGGTSVPVLCDKSAFINPSTATTTQIVALSGSTVVYVCAYQVSFVGSATANSGIFKYGTGTACGTGTTSLSGTLWGPNATGSGTEFSGGSGIGTVLRTIAGQALCFTTSAATTVSVTVSYAQF